MQDLMIPPTSNPKGMDATPIIKKTSTIIIPNAKAKRKGSFIKKQNKKTNEKKYQILSNSHYLLIFVITSIVDRFVLWVVLLLLQNIMMILN